MRAVKPAPFDHRALESVDETLGPPAEFAHDGSLAGGHRPQSKRTPVPEFSSTSIASQSSSYLNAPSGSITARSGAAASAFGNILPAVPAARKK
jgi:hypothetical protein